MEEKLEQESSLTVEEIAWNRLKNSRITEGFADGKFQGGEANLQNGFDKGYATGFSFTLPFSIIQGLLAVNEMMLKEKNSHLLSKSSDLKQSLNEFEKKCNGLNLNTLVSHHCETNDYLQNDASNNPHSHELSSGDCSCKSQNFDPGSKVPDVQDTLLLELTEDFKELRQNTTNFIGDCGQPMLLDQIMCIFQQFNLQDSFRKNQCYSRSQNSQCNHDSESTP